jgi:hypothetical protein
MFPVVCIEVLVASIVAWVGVWGIAHETVQLAESRTARCCIPRCRAPVQRSLTVCALL